MAEHPNLCWRNRCYEAAVNYQVRHPEAVAVHCCVPLGERSRPIPHAWVEVERSGRWYVVDRALGALRGSKTAKGQPLVLPRDAYYAGFGLKLSDCQRYSLRESLNHVRHKTRGYAFGPWKTHCR